MSISLHTRRAHRALALLMAAALAGFLIAQASATTTPTIIHFTYTYYARVVRHDGQQMVLLTSLKVEHARGVTIYVGCGTADPRHQCARKDNPISVKHAGTRTVFRALNYLLAVGSTFDIQALAPGHIGRFALLEAERHHHRFALMLARHGCLSRLGVTTSCSVSVSVTSPSSTSGATGSSGESSSTGSTPPTPQITQTPSPPLPPPTPTFTLSLAVSGSGTITATDVSCTSSCSETYPEGTAVTLTATPASGYSFAGWGGACSGTGSCILTVNANASVAATFVATDTLTETVTGSGTISGSGTTCTSSCTQSYTPGTIVRLTATPATGYSFAGWGGACSGTAACSFTISAATSVTASFTAATETLTVSRSGPASGTVSGGGIDCGSTCSATLPYGTTVTLTASAPWDVSFGGWSGGGCSGTGTCVIKLTSDVEVAAPFTGYVETSKAAITDVWTDFTTATGTQGTAITAGQSVVVACSVTGLAVGGDTHWYRLTSSPWDGLFYAPAADFYNEAGTSAGGPAVDPAVPAC